jgi:hypothetical protein
MHADTVVSLLIIGKMEDHQHDTCSHRMVSCQYCTRRMQLIALPSHQSSLPVLISVSLATATKRSHDSDGESATKKQRIKDGADEQERKVKAMPPCRGVTFCPNGCKANNDSVKDGKASRSIDGNSNNDGNNGSGDDNNDGLVLMRHDVATHLLTCARASVVCKICHDEMYRGDMERHLTNSAAKHIASLATLCESLRNQTDEVITENQRIKDAIICDRNMYNTGT